MSPRAFLSPETELFFGSLLLNKWGLNVNIGRPDWMGMGQYTEYKFMKLYFSFDC